MANNSFNTIIKDLNANNQGSLKNNRGGGFGGGGISNGGIGGRGFPTGTGYIEFTNNIYHCIFTNLEIFNASSSNPKDYNTTYITQYIKIRLYQAYNKQYFPTEYNKLIYIFIYLSKTPIFIIEPDIQTILADEYSELQKQKTAEELIKYFNGRYNIIDIKVEADRTS